MSSMMNSLKVPDSGLRLQASGGDGLPVPPQAFFLTLEDNAIESMIKAVQSGQELSLKLGNEPVCLLIHQPVIDIRQASHREMSFAVSSCLQSSYRFSNTDRTHTSLNLLLIHCRTTCTLHDLSSPPKAPNEYHAQGRCSENPRARLLLSRHGV